MQILVMVCMQIKIIKVYQIIYLIKIAFILTVPMGNKINLDPKLAEDPYENRINKLSDEAYAKILRQIDTDHGLNP